MITHRIKKPTMSQAKKWAWDAFSLWVRFSSVDFHGLVACYTCDRKYNYKKMHPGHWVTGHGNVTYINPIYVRPQCYYCNIQLAGNQGEFRDRIRKELGNSQVDRLLREAKQIKKISIKQYLELEKHYLAELEKLNFS